MINTLLTAIESAAMFQLDALEYDAHHEAEPQVRAFSACEKRRVDDHVVDGTRLLVWGAECMECGGQSTKEQLLK